MPLPDLFEKNGPGSGSGGRGSRGGGRTPGPPDPPVPPEGTNDGQTRISPVIFPDSNGKTYREKMEKETLIVGKKQIQIDVDREGGVFLDHGELADLLESGKIDEVIKETENSLTKAANTIDRNTRNNPDYYRWDGYDRGSGHSGRRL